MVLCKKAMRLVHAFNANSWVVAALWIYSASDYPLPDVLGFMACLWCSLNSIHAAMEEESVRPE